MHTGDWNALKPVKLDFNAEGETILREWTGISGKSRDGRIGCAGLIAGVCRFSANPQASAETF